MSTLATELAGTFVPAASPSPPSLLGRLIETREKQADRYVQRHLAAMDDGRLRRLGCTDQDIQALRAGELRLPR